MFEGVPLSQTLNSGVSTVHGRPRALRDAADDVDHDGRASSSDSIESRRTGLELVPHHADAPHGGAGDHRGHARRRLPPLHPGQSRIYRTTAASWPGLAVATFADRTKVDLVLSRDVQYSFELNEPYYLTTGFRVVVNHQLRETTSTCESPAARDRLDYRAEERCPIAVPDEKRTDLADSHRRRRRLSPAADVPRRLRRRVCAANRAAAIGRDFRTHADCELRFLIYGVQLTTGLSTLLLALRFLLRNSRLRRSSTEYIVGTQDRLSITVVDEPSSRASSPSGRTAVSTIPSSGW